MGELNMRLLNFLSWLFLTDVDPSIEFDVPVIFKRTNRFLWVSAVYSIFQLLKNISAVHDSLGKNEFS